VFSSLPFWFLADISDLTPYHGSISQDDRNDEDGNRKIGYGDRRRPSTQPPRHSADCPPYGADHAPDHGACQMTLSAWRDDDGCRVASATRRS